MSDYNGSVVRAIRGPVCLITIGALFALNNFTRYRFDQTWPVILIVFGLLSLLRRGVETSAPPPPPPRPGSYTGSGYSQSPYSQTPPGAASSPAPASTAGSPSEPAKGGFGSSAPPRAAEAPPSTPSSGEGGPV